MPDPSVPVQPLPKQDAPADEALRLEQATLARVPEEEEESLDEVLAGIAEGYKEVIAGDHEPIEELFARLA